MRALRFLSPILIVALAVTGLMAWGSLARAQSVEEQEVEEAQERADAATGLVDTAVARRTEIEAELASSITKINDLTAEMSRVSSSVEALKAQIGFADAVLSGIEADLESHAINAYMTALVSPGVSFMNSTTVEKVMVAGQVVEDVVNSGQERVDELVVKRDALEDLKTAYQAQQEEVDALRAEVDAEIEHLTALYEEADAEVGAAIRKATEADAAYREALSEVEAAQAREAERERQEQRDAARPADPGDDPPPSPSTTTTAPPAATTTDGGGGGTWDFPPAVERWRATAEEYFPGNRVDEALAVLQCESLGDPDAYNPYTGASGLFQFLPATWAGTAPNAGFPGASPFDPEANIGTAAWVANRYQELGKGYWSPWSCRRVLG